MLSVNPPPPLQLHASQAVHQSPQQGAPPLQFLHRKTCHFRKIHPPVSEREILIEQNKNNKKKSQLKLSEPHSTHRPHFRVSPLPVLPLYRRGRHRSATQQGHVSPNRAPPVSLGLWTSPGNQENKESDTTRLARGLVD